MEAALFGSELWEKIIVTPSVVALGYILGTVQLAVDVWCTRQRAAAAMTDLEVSGSGLSAANPYGLPLTYWPMQARDFEVLIPEEGDAQLDGAVIFLFDGVAAADTTCGVTGTRVVVFPFEPDWNEKVVERAQYLTQIIAGRSSKEQRIQMRKRPRPVHAFSVFTTDAAETAALTALLAGWQGRIFGVPIWPDMQPLAAALEAGALAVSVSTELRAFAAPGMAAIWRDSRTFEAINISAVAAGGLTLSSPTVQAWPADGRTFVVPLLLGRVPDSLDLSKLTADIAQAAVEFQCEVV